MISFSGVFVKVAAVTPTVAAFYRMFFGGLILAALALMQTGRRWDGWRTLGRQAVCALFFALDLFFWHRSIHLVGPGLATILANFQVFILAVLGIVFLGESFHWRLLLAASLAVAGLFLVVGIDWQQLHRAYKHGVGYGLLAALWYAVYLVTLRRLQGGPRPLSPFKTLTVVSFFTAAYLFAQASARQESFWIPDLTSWLALLAYGLLCQTAGWLLITRALPQLRASMAGLLLLLQPALAFVWDMLFFDRPTTGLNLLGVGLTLGAIYLGSRRGGKAPTPQTVSDHSQR